MPGYILSRITANFGASGSQGGDCAGRNSISNSNNLLGPGNNNNSSSSNNNNLHGSMNSSSCPHARVEDYASPAEFLKQNHTPTKSDFHFMKQLSSGAYGAVYLAKHSETQEQVAIKCLKKRDMLNKNMVHQVMAERDILMFARNPFIVNLLCSFLTKESLYLVMEYAPGGDLATQIKKLGPMPEETARRYFAEAVLAVEYIHEFGIVHRDLKPDNLVVGRCGHIKLTDFGLSRIGLMNTATLMAETEIGDFRDGQVLGTPDYIAPEVFLGRGYGKPVDWWSMGIILYEFIMGEPPFMGETPEDVCNRVVNSEPDFPDPEEMSDLARDLIERLLCKDPVHRLGTPPALTPLDGYAHVEPGAAYIKDHEFFSTPIEGDILDWDLLLQSKAAFVPSLENELDTSYFDTRSDRYKHELSEGSSESDKEGSGDDRGIFRHFSSAAISPFLPSL
jgi:microtubule-associated serine/threonine kinase